MSSSTTPSLMHVFRTLTTDEAFLDRVNTTITAIMKDGKIDQYDIPDLVFLIADVINQLENTQLTSDSVEALLVLLYNFIINKYNLIPTDGNTEGFKRLFESSIRLAMIQPIVKKTINRCFSFCRK
jgi:hypothetical protein